MVPITPPRGSFHPALLALFLVMAGCGGAAQGARPDTAEDVAALAGSAQAALRGTVVDASGAPVAGALVTAERLGTPLARTVTSGTGGLWQLDDVADGRWRLRAAWPGGAPGAADTAAAGAAAVTLTLPASTSAADLPAAAFLSLLPPGNERRAFMLDCTGCHVFDDWTALPGGTPRTEASWRDAVGRMLGFAGPQSGFPVIAAGREPGGTAAWLSDHVTAAAVAGLRPPTYPGQGRAAIAEYAMPVATDLPHDVAVDRDGRVIITGMMTGAMWVLDPEAAAFERVPIPLDGAPNPNPRAVELDAAGNWWVLLGGPMTMARRTPAGAWSFWPIGLYPHSIALAEDGGVWYNGHFSRNPEVVARLDPGTAAIRTVEVPAHPQAHVGAGPMPYELRTGPDGAVWGSELLGNRVFALHPATGSFRVWDMPEPFGGPRRLDVAADGKVWIPLYGAGMLARLDPADDAIRTWPLPVANAAPYIAREDPETGIVWIATGAADAAFAFDPATERFTSYPLPTRGALVRHMVVVPGREVWLAYGASPGVAAKVARLRPMD